MRLRVCNTLVSGLWPPYPAFLQNATSSTDQKLHSSKTNARSGCAHMNCQDTKLFCLAIASCCHPPLLLGRSVRLSIGLETFDQPSFSTKSMSFVSLARQTRSVFFLFLSRRRQHTAESRCKTRNGRVIQSAWEPWIDLRNRLVAHERWCTLSFNATVPRCPFAAADSCCSVSLGVAL